MKTHHFVSCCYFCALCAVTLQDPIVSSDIVGNNITLGCPLSGAAGKNKYFCKGTCSGEDILIETTLDNHQKGRYRIEDTRETVFYVAIMDLKMTDSGRYWCSVDRLIKDSYHELNIQVNDAQTSAQPSVVTLEPKMSAPSTPKPLTPCSGSSTKASATGDRTSLSSTTTSPSTDTRGQSLSGYVLYAGLGLLVLVTIGMALTLLLYKKKTKRPPENASSNVVHAESSKTEAVYEEVALEDASINIDEHTFNHATAFNAQNGIVSDVNANCSSPDNVMDSVCTMHELDEDPGVPVTKNNPIYSLSS